MHSLVVTSLHVLYALHHSGACYTAISLRWISGGFFVQKLLSQGLCLVRFPHPWGKFARLILPQGQANDMCIKLNSVTLHHSAFCLIVLTENVQSFTMEYNKIKVTEHSLQNFGV